MKIRLYASVLLGCLLVGCEDPEARRLAASEHKRVIDVGVVLPLTGELGNFGTTVLNGIQLAFEDVKDSIEIRIHVEDSQGESSHAVTAIQKLLSAHGVEFVIGSLTSGETAAMAPIAHNHHAILISPTASNPQLTSAGPYFYRVWPSDSYDGTAAAQFAYQHLNAETSAIIYLRNDYATGLRDVFSATFTSGGGIILTSTGYREDELNFRPIIGRLKDASPDVVYLPGHPRGIAAFLQQARELDFATHFLANVAAEDQEFVALAGRSAAGLYFTAPAYDSTMIVPKEFARRYEARHNVLPDIHAAKGFDAAMVLRDGLLAGFSTAEEMRRFLDGRRTFSGAAGQFNFDSNGDVVGSVAVKRYEDQGHVRTEAVVNPQ